MFEQETWDFRTLDFDADVEFGHAKAGAVLNATSPDLRSFRANGGKLIQYHGWGDAAISPLSSIEYYESVRAFMTRFPDARHAKGDAADFHRLFMVPGMAHCSGGVGATDFGNGRKFAHDDAERNLLSALEAWVEKGVAPTKLIATGTAVADPRKGTDATLVPLSADGTVRRHGRSQQRAQLLVRDALGSALTGASDERSDEPRRYGQRAKCRERRAQQFWKACVPNAIGCVCPMQSNGAQERTRTSTVLPAST